MHFILYWLILPSPVILRVLEWTFLVPQFSGAPPLYSLCPACFPWGFPRIYQYFLNSERSLGSLPCVAAWKVFRAVRRSNHQVQSVHFPFSGTTDLCGLVPVIFKDIFPHIFYLFFFFSVLSDGRGNLVLLLLVEVHDSVKKKKPTAIYTNKNQS